MASSVGSLLTLYDTLVASPTLQGVSVAFGEETINDQTLPLPLVCIVPGVGRYTMDDGTWAGTDPAYDFICKLQETHELWMWAVGTGIPQGQPIANADAIENLRAWVLQALWLQRSSGLYFNPIAGGWRLNDSGLNRYGRAYVLQVQMEITIPDVPPLAAQPPITVSQSVTNT